ncbi:MAG TPA: glycosyltransferase family 2 protein [Nitrospirota bacterium]|nr:glycosyltransferase family 2 protein [Nitrospirota bacterium]
MIVNWNGKHLLGECLESLRRQTFQDFEIVIVDNDSRDGSVEYIRERYREVNLVTLPVNKGFAGGNNAGIRIASGSYIALLNNDTKTDPTWLENLIKEAESNPAAGMLACKILSYSDPDIIDNVGLLIYRDGLARGKGRLERDRGQYDQKGEALFPSGCAGLYRRNLLEETGLFDEEFFAYADDVDLGLRGRLTGWGCVYVPAAKVYHKYSSSSASYSSLKAFLVERNRVWVLLKYYPAELIVASAYFTAKRLLLQFYGALSGKGASGRFTAENSMFHAVTVLLRAWCSALAATPQVLRQRWEFAKKKRIGRREFYRLIREFGISASEIALRD